ncbi:trans-aconitate 2-methyltransferase [Streptomyces sp. TS71-3]|uniref:class I SAM-dependent methyltransferase n=1 Tax=Streptomyces sp. TS71-3 TaxID=2733862 RepID=UPI001B074A9B|nr:class I SAM-dependent methyltransferase [Streptomyces sp. TS71-3]GHJ41247.1 methyltransferase [Streptomyces sp. TS71-3]
MTDTAPGPRTTTHRQGGQAAAGWRQWQESWDRQQEWYMPDREERFRVMLDVLEALTGPEPTVLDLACGTGSITDRLLRRLPGARSTGVDLDPALLTIARGHFAGEGRVEFVTADLTDRAWPEALPHRTYDAVVTATALHWLDTEPLRILYGRLAGVLREGGVFLNADHMTDESAPRINAAVKAFHEARMARERDAGAQDWAAWWTAAAQEPALAEVTRERFTLLGDPRRPPSGSEQRDRPTTVRWHTDALRAAGFDEVRQAWCSTSDALLVAVR